MSERPTPLSIVVCMLIALQSDRGSPYYEIELEEGTREQVVRLLHSAVDEGWTNGIRGFLHSIHDAVEESITNVLVNYLQELTGSIDALVDLIDSLQKALVANTIDGASPYGIFVRKTCLGFDELSFETVARLWEALRQEVDYAVSSLHDGAASSSFASSWPMSPTQIETQLRKQCLELERTDHCFHETELAVHQILRNDPDLPTAHFLRFLNCLRHGERVDALYAIHKYFDFVRIREYRTDSQPRPDQRVNDRRNGVLPYASIVLAALHHSFGEHSLSLKATEEAVRVAQESNDTACVAYALGWLYRNHPNGLDAEALLRKCATRAGSVRPLVAGAQMSLAQHYLGSSNVSTVARAWESLYSASSVGAISTGTATTLDRPAYITYETTSDDAMVVLAQQALVGAGVWEACGLPVLSGLSSEIALSSYPRGISLQDRALANQNIARGALYGPRQRHESSCRYATALRAIARSGSLEEPNGSILAVALVLHEWAIRRGDLAHARYLISILWSSLHLRVPNRQATVIDALSQYSLLLIRQEQWDKAYKLTKYICNMCNKEGMRTRHASLLIQLATLHLHSGCNAFTGALPPLLECLSMCERHSIDSYHAAALSVLAQVHLRLRDTTRAMSLLNASLPSLLQHMHVSFAAEAYLTLAKCYLHRAKLRDSKDGKSPVRILRAACSNLEKSRALFYECHDLVRLKEVYYLQAMTNNSVPGNVEKRNEASRRFVQASKQLAKSRHATAQVAPWGSLKDLSYIEDLASRPLVISQP